MQNLEVQAVEKLVRAVVSEVYRTQNSSVPRFSKGKTYEKRVSAPISASTPVSASAPVPVQISTPIQSSIPEKKVESPAKTLKSDEILLDKQVITLRDVENLPRCVRRVIVPQSAILTPSVRDELSEHEIRLARYSAEAIQAFSTAISETTGNAQTQINRSRLGALEVYSLFTLYHPEALFSHWTRCGLRPNLRSGFVCFDGIRTSMVKNETLNVLFTSRVDEALCRLHRDERIRAIHSVHPEKLSAQWKDFPSANTLVVNPTEIGIYLAGQVIMRGAELFYHG